MKPTTTPDPILLALLACWLAAEALALLLIHAAALLAVLAGWRPRPQPAAVAAPPKPPAPPCPALPSAPQPAPRPARKRTTSKATRTRTTRTQEAIA